MLLGVRLPPPVLSGSPDDSAGVVRVPTAAETRKTLRRDNGVCQVCGFRATRYQRVVAGSLLNAAIDVDGGSRTLPPFVTLCQFCELCVALDRVGITGMGTLIWLPEISQPDLNNLVRALYVAQASGDPALVPLASKALQTLAGRAETVQKRLGTDDPSVLATVLIENCDPQTRAHARHKLDGIRLLPHDRWYVRTARGDADIFKRLIAFWRSSDGPFADLPVQSWTEAFTKLT